MLRFLADEDFDGRIVRGLRRQLSDLDLVRVQDVGLQEATDAPILQWAEDHGRIVLSHDARTMPAEAAQRFSAGLHLPGLFIIRKSVSIGACIADILLAAECSEPEEWRDLIVYFPLQ